MAEGSLVDYLVTHRKTILKAYRELGPSAAREKLIPSLPRLKPMGETTFAQYVRVMAALVTALNATHDTQLAIDTQSDTQDGPAIQIATQPDNATQPDTQKIHSLESGLTEATQLIHKLQAENADLRNQLATQKLHMAGVTQNDTHMPSVTQLATQEGTDTQMLHNEVATHDDIHKGDTQAIHMETATQTDTHKGPVTIEGWSVQFSGGYYRAHRRVAGKMKTIYLGKTLDQDSARDKIQVWEKRQGTEQ